MMEWLLNHTPLTVSFMLTIRLSVAGIILLTYLSSFGRCERNELCRGTIQNPDALFICATATITPRRN
ncbi:dethiobiotin synthetase [Lysinibacillus sp. RC79]